MALLHKPSAMTEIHKKKRPAKRSWEKKPVAIDNKIAKKNNPEILDFLPLQIVSLLEKSEHKFSHSEQIMIALFAQIIVEIVLKEEL